jgi:hypothetical protein
MKRSTIRPWTAVVLVEGQARARLQQERKLNSVIASRNPHLPSTERYREGPLPPWLPRFGTRADYLRYLARREMGRFDSEVVYPTPRNP